MNNNLKDSILEQINSGDARMRPRFYFILQICALALVTIAVLVLSIIICNFIFFSLRINGPIFELFPWWLLVADIALIALLEWLLRKFSFGYRNPVLYVVLGIVVIVIALSLFIDRVTSINDTLLHRADAHQLPPPFGDFVEGARRPLPPGSGLYKATIVAIGNDTLTVDLFGTTTPFTVLVRPGDHIVDSLHIGDVILVSGRDVATSTIHANSIHQLPSVALPSQE